MSKKIRVYDCDSCGKTVEQKEIRLVMIRAGKFLWLCIEDWERFQSQK